ncbi:MAG: ABC transporter permease subunit [Cyanobacteria bacterium]|nr:ABC transporter permease subunit [Cyanobacteria bacterium CG_2015-16_32_12]NCO78278.1 ABC transporter permease subunit [Cyanobacteria bacterium CG_2015-22_32_23]NCQ02915.1 ABC transporter permease subunit [Cyanobacteria bacterium CG_2015-09_32_10]NCS83504.1 ABC transporter permease subunit [Cyanobacteria bacterium CG_2015-02_32_10]
MKTFPTPETLRRFPFGLADIVVILGTLVLLAIIAKLGQGTLVTFRPPDVLPTVDLGVENLVYYTGRSTLRMFIALFCSTVFTLVYGYIAANSVKAERIMIPLLDILQSVPVLGFLSITVTGFIALFPGSLLGLEAASIFAIFTSQVWNMTFSFYQSLKTVPKELQEAAVLYQLSGWQKFVKLEVPSATIGLLWNAMMSFGGGWFFVTASEAISVLNQEYTLPGIGSYLAMAITQENMMALGEALVAMTIMIILVDQFFWRPLIAWSDKFRLEQSASVNVIESWVYDILTTARIPTLVAQSLTPFSDRVNEILSALSKPSKQDKKTVSSNSETIYNITLWLILGILIALILHFIISTVGIGEIFRVLGLGFLTLLRVTFLLIFATLIWTPIGVAIGFNPKLANFLQPVVQFLASFPANFIFPFATLFFIRFNISLGWGSILLMALGAQWYILFNSIAGAQSIPTDLREMSQDIGLKGWQRWQKLIIPGIFSAWVTGGVTASGGAWNASIIAEVVSWGSNTLVAEGLGSYITKATEMGDWPRIALGIAIMSLFVVGINRLFWRKLYQLAEEKYHL